MTDHPYNLTGLFSILLKWRKPLIAVVVAAALVSALVAWLLPNEYKSTTVFYPTDLNTINPEQVLGPYRKESDLFGNTEDIDRMLTIAYSQPLADYIIRKFKLAEHYGLDTTQEANRHYLHEEFLDNFVAEHTERDALSVSFYDKDKNIAAAIANEIAARIDQINQQLTTENRKNILGIYQNRYQFLQVQYDQMRDSLQKSRRQFRIFGSLRDTVENRHESQFLAKQLVETETALRRAQAETPQVKSKIAGLEKALNGLTSANGNLINYESYLAGTDVVSGLEAQYIGLQREFIKAKQAYLNAKLAFEGNISSIYIIQKAYPAVKKARPIRWLIVLGSTVLAFILALAFIGILEAKRNHLPA